MIEISIKMIIFLQLRTSQNVVCQKQPYFLAAPNSITFVVAHQHIDARTDAIFQTPFPHAFRGYKSVAIYNNFNEINS